MYKKKIIVVVLAFLIVGAIFTAGCLDEEEGAQNSPKSAVKEFLKKADDKKGEEALELTDADLLKDNESLSESIEKIKNSIDDGNMTHSDYEILDVVYQEDMDGSNRSQMEDMTQWYEEENGVSVEDTCFVKVEITSDERTDKLSFRMIKSDGKWYVAFLYVMQPRDDTEQQSGSLANDEMTSPKEYKISFAKFSPERSISELSFALETPDEGTAIDSFSSDVSGAEAEFSTLQGYQLNYTDVVENAVINSGDQLIVYNPNDLPSGSYELMVLYNGDEVDTISWTI